MHSLGTFPSANSLYLWACDTPFRVMTTAQDGEGCIIDILEAGSVLTKIESFHIQLRGSYGWVLFSNDLSHFHAYYQQPSRL